MKPIFVKLFCNLFQGSSEIFTAVYYYEIRGVWIKKKQQHFVVSCHIYRGLHRNFACWKSTCVYLLSYFNRLCCFWFEGLRFSHDLWLPFCWNIIWNRNRTHSLWFQTLSNCCRLLISGQLSGWLLLYGEKAYEMGLEDLRGSYHDESMTLMNPVCFPSQAT